MRRLWAYIIASLTAIIMVGACICTVAAASKSNLEYTDGREITFRINDVDGKYEGDEVKLMKNALEKMEERLKNAGISQYKITSSGTNILKVDVVSNTDNDYSTLATYLSSYGVKSLTNRSTISAPIVFSDIRTGDAYIETVESINPVINLPINIKTKSGERSFKELKEETMKDESNAETEEEGEGDDKKEVKKYYFYLWYDYEEGRDSIAKTVSGNDEYDEVVASRLSSIKFNIEDVSDDEEKTNLKLYIKVDADGDEKASEKEIKDAFKNAQSYVNILNADALDYTIETIANDIYHRSNSIIETLISCGNVVLSKTLISFLVAFFILSFLLIVFYRLGALAIISSTLVSTFSAFGIIVSLAAEITTAGIVGILLVSIASMVSGVIYMTKLKEDAYRGHTLKKANSEAAKKSLLPIVDVHIVIMIIGAFIFILGGAAMKGFAIATVLGGLVSLGMNIAYLKATLWLATNSTNNIGHYERFGIEKKNIPNHLLEETQRYYGPFEKKDFTKKKKPVGIATLVLFIGSLVGMITIGVLTSGYLFNSGNNAMNATAGYKQLNTSIYIGELKGRNAEDYILLDSDVNDVVNTLLIYEKDVEIEKLKPFSTIVNNYKNETTTYSTYEFKTPMESEEDTNKWEFRDYKYTIISLKISVDLENYLVINKEDSSKTLYTLEEAFIYLLDLKSYDTFDILVQNDVTKINVTAPSWQEMSIASIVGTLVLALYFMIRYRLSMGLASLLFPVIASTIGIAFISLLRIVSVNYVTIAIPVIVAFTFIIASIFMNKNKEMFDESKTKNLSLETRKEMMIKANSLAYTPIIVTAILACYIFINFFGFGPSASTTFYLSMLIGSLVAVVTVTTLLGPIYMFLYSKFSKISFTSPKEKIKEKKKNKKKTTNSNEPKEAIFIGIND